MFQNLSVSHRTHFGFFLFRCLVCDQGPGLNLPWERLPAVLDSLQTLPAYTLVSGILVFLILLYILFFLSDQLKALFVGSGRYSWTIRRGRVDSFSTGTTIVGCIREIRTRPAQIDCLVDTLSAFLARVNFPDFFIPLFFIDCMLMVNKHFSSNWVIGSPGLPWIALLQFLGDVAIDFVLPWL